MNKKKLIACIVVVLVIAIIVAMWLMLGGNKASSSGGNTTSKQGKSTTNYSGKIASNEEVTKNKEKDEQLIDLAHELMMTDDMVSHELGYDENSSSNMLEGMSEEEKKAHTEMSSERYYQQRDEIMTKINELLK